MKIIIIYAGVEGNGTIRNDVTSQTDLKVHSETRVKLSLTLSKLEWLTVSSHEGNKIKT